MEKFHDLTRYYEDLHDEHAWSQAKIAVSTFYEGFLNRFDDVFTHVHNPRIRAVADKLRQKAEQMLQFDEREPVHDLAEKTVDRLNALGMELYALPDVEYLLESSQKIELNVLMSCCPEFQHETTEDGQAIGCVGTVKQLSFGIDQDLQAAVRMYYEKYCRDCEKRAVVESHLNQECDTAPES
jgi:hypothetical protein